MSSYKELCDYLNDKNETQPTKKNMGEIVKIVETVLQRNCSHPEEHRHIKTIGGGVNCETTVTECLKCGKQLTEPETDC